MIARRPVMTGRRRAIGALVGLVLLGSAPTASAAGGGTISSHVRASPLLVVLDLSATGTQVGQPVKAQATVSNLSKSLVKKVTVEMRFDPVGLRINKATTEIAQIKPGKSTSVSWSVCGQLPGTYVLLARVTLDGVSIDSSARLLTVAAGGKKTCS
jgi:hypothetical protein